MKVAILAAVACAIAWAAGPAAAAPPLAPFADRRPADEVVYFVLPDRFENGDPGNDLGGLRGDRLKTGYDPTAKGFYHGGDLKGLTARLDYIAGLGATAVWVGPIFKNKPVQGPPGQESAGYHGYWITDFTDVDPHFGTRADFKTFVDAAHAKGLRVYMDIIANHTADVIQYRDCPAQGCVYRSEADFPYQRRGGVEGAAINAGFKGPGDGSVENFSRLTDPSYAYAPFVPAAEKDVKKPAWLNDPIYYHNRGDSTFAGESSTLGDFSGLDDIFTEHPRVVAGMIDIYGKWIDDFGVDGFRIDTARHVDSAFWRAFIPAMQARAKARGIAHFHIFGEVYDPDPGRLARFTRIAAFPATLDFAFQHEATAVIGDGAGTDRLARLFESDPLYDGGADAAMDLPTFLGNHDMGRFAFMVRRDNPKISDAELLARVTLGDALLMFARGMPVIYSGDEQGFTGDGGDQDAREDMFPSRVDSYNDNRLVGSTSTTANSNFDTSAKLYQRLAEMARIRAETPALRRGRLVSRAYGDKPGLYVFSRILDGAEALVAINTGSARAQANVTVETGSSRWRALHGSCTPSAAAPGSYGVDVAPLDYVVCISDRNT